MADPTGEAFLRVCLRFKKVGALVIDPIFAVGAFVRDRCLGGTVAAATSVAAFATAAVAFAEGFGGEGGD